MEVDTNKEGDNSATPKHAVHWFRRGLRLHDNPALLGAIQGATTLRCVFVLDPWAARGAGATAVNKWRFLLESLTDLSHSLSSRLGCRLSVIRGQPADVLPALLGQWGATHLTFETDPEPYGRARDRKLAARCREMGVIVQEYASHTLYALESIIERNGGRAPVTFEQFRGVLEQAGPPSPPAEPVTRELLGDTRTPREEGHDERYGVPTLEELGFDITVLENPVWRGGEAEALVRLERHLESRAHKGSTSSMSSTEHNGQETHLLMANRAGLSPYLRFGCLSARLYYHQLAELCRRPGRSILSSTLSSLHGPLLWREFLYCAGTNNPRFDRMRGNPLCVQIPWDNDPTALAKWANGQTGFPWIDAVMSQLRSEGWIHHIARHAVVSFLTTGALWLSWEEGMKVFEELLLDADWSVNAGCWLWLSCSSFFQKFSPSCCPVALGRRVDPNGDYIRRYVPALRGFSVCYVHSPWEAPASVQRLSGCVLGRDYPLPMIDHTTARRNNRQRLRQAYGGLSRYRDRNGLSEAFEETEDDHNCGCEPSTNKEK